MTTIEERAKAVTDEVGTATTGAELRALIAQALRDQIEDCAKVADRRIEEIRRTYSDSDPREYKEKLTRLTEANFISGLILALADSDSDKRKKNQDALKACLGPPALSPSKQAAVERGIERAEEVERRWETN